MRNILAAITLLSIIYSCGSHGDQTRDRSLSMNNGEITIGKDSPVAKKISTAEVKKSLSRTSVSTSGIVKAIPSSYAEVAIPFPGRITKSYVKLGDRVQKGSPLFEISSPELFETAKAHSQADQEMALAEKNLSRQRQLYDGKMCSIRELEEVETIYKNAVKEHESSKAALEAYGIDPDNASVGQPLTIVSPVAGKVVRNSLVIGQYLKEDADPQVIVADLSKVWVIANVKERDINSLSEKSGVSISLISSPDSVITGKLVNISELLDPETRSVEVVIECDNSSRLMKPNMYGTVTFNTSEKEMPIIPDSAIFQEEGTKYVFLQSGENKYRKVFVSTYETAGDSSAVVSGLNGGENIIVSGAFYLIDVK